MSEIIFNKKGIISLGSIDGEEDLKPRPGVINLNPPPEDGKCQFCGKHISELNPFGGSGDPLVGDFTGAYLVKTWRPDGPYDEEAEVNTEKANELYEKDGYDDPLDWMIDKYGKEKGERLFYTAWLYGCISKSWLCRNCILLDVNEYHEKLGHWVPSGKPE